MRKIELDDYEEWEYDRDGITHIVCPESFATAVLFHEGSREDETPTAAVVAMSRSGVQTLLAVNKTQFLALYPWWPMAGNINDLQWQLPCQVDKNVFWSGRSVVRAPACLAQLQINAVVDLSSSNQNSAGVPHYLPVPIDDSEDALDAFLSYLPRVETFIMERLQAGDRLLVHCDAGRSRSASVILAHIMRTQQLSADGAYEAMKLIRPLVMEARTGCLFHSYKSRRS